MNIITNADVKKFLTILKAGLKDGTNKELKIYDNATCYDGTNVPKEWYCSLEFRFRIDAATFEGLFIEEDNGLTNQIDEMLNK